MKKQLLCAVFSTAIVLFTTHSFAQIDLKLRPAGLVLSTISSNVEFGVTDNFGIEGIVGYDWRKTTLSFSNSSISYRNDLLRLGLNARYYFNPTRGIDNFYAGIYTRYRGGSLNPIDSTNLESIQRSRIALGVLVGYKVVSRNEKIIFDFSMGLGRAIQNTFKDDQSEFSLSSLPFLNIDLPVSISIGYRFGGGDGDSRGSSKSSKRRG